MTRAVVVVALLAAAAAAGASGCGGSGTRTVTTTVPAAPTTTTPTTTAARTEPAETGGIDTMPGAGTTAVTAPAQGGAALLAAIGLARHEGYDRVVFQFANRLPGYRIAYVRPPFHEDGSGKPIAVDGGAFVFVRMEPASGYDLANDKLVYQGPRRITGAAHGTSIVREAVRTGDFESVLGWVVGVEEQVDFRVLRLQDPPRLVLDFRNH